MKYANQEKSAVIYTKPDGQVWTVPRGHRYWAQFGIDAAEQRGEIEDAEIFDPDGSGSSTANPTN